MSAHSVKTSSKIKDAIGTLCQFLALSGFSSISPETFRQAKFDRSGAIGPLLQLLGELLEFSNSSKCTRIAEPRQDIISTIHQALLKRCFPRHNFYTCLDLTKHVCISSRELLIAIGWLFCSEDLLRKTAMKSQFSNYKTFPDIDRKIDICKQVSKPHKDIDGNLDEQLNQLTWTIGKCRMASKQLYWKQREVIRLAHRIHVATEGVSLSKEQTCLSPAGVFILKYEVEFKKVIRLVHRVHVATDGTSLSKEQTCLSPANVFVLKCEVEFKQVVRLAQRIYVTTEGVSLSNEQLCLSPADVFVLKDEVEFKKHLDSLEKENRRLQLFCQFQEREDIFWQWMESVLEAAPSGDSGGDARHLQDSNFSLAEHAKRLDVRQIELQQALKDVVQKVHNHQTVSSLPVAGACQLIDTAVRESSNRPDTLMGTFFQYLPPERTMSTDSRKKKEQNNNEWLLNMEVRDIEQEISLLTAEVRSLETQIHEHRESSSSLFRETVTSQDGVVAIPPISLEER